MNEVLQRMSDAAKVARAEYPGERLHGHTTLTVEEDHILVTTHAFIGQQKVMTARQVPYIDVETSRSNIITYYVRQAHSELRQTINAINKVLG